MDHVPFYPRLALCALLVGTLGVGCGPDTDPIATNHIGGAGGAGSHSKGSSVQGGSSGQTHAALGGFSSSEASVGGSVAGGSGGATSKSTSSGASRQSPYRACSSAVASGEAPTIANFDDGTLSVAPNEGRGGVWFNYDDGSDGSLVTRAESGALHIVSGGWSTWGAAVAAQLGPSVSDQEHCFYDASRYAGVRFRAKGRGVLRTMVATVGNIPVSQGGECERSFNDCYNLPGTLARLTDEWRTYELLFCKMREEDGWGGTVSPVDPAEVVALHFRIAMGQDFDGWIDDLEFFSAEDAQVRASCEGQCPMDLASYPESIVPERSYLRLTDELSLHTFDQSTTHCGSIRRRYLNYVPSSLGANSNAPVLIALHGSGANAETFQSEYTRGRFDALAARDGFIVVYGNAAPGEYDGNDPRFMNTGSFRQSHFDDGEVDDIEYLVMVLDDLKSRSVISGTNDVFLVGLSNGGGMTIQAAIERPELFRGIAPFMPYAGNQLPTIPDLTGTGLRRVMFGYSLDDPSLTGGYAKVPPTFPAKWAKALGLPSEVIENPVRTERPNLINEGENYTGTNAIALRTRNSSVTQLDMSAPDREGSVRVLEIARGGHLWPNPAPLASGWDIDSFGFRNQDIDACDEVWEFFSR